MLKLLRDDFRHARGIQFGDAQCSIGDARRGAQIAAADFRQHRHAVRDMNRRGLERMRLRALGLVMKFDAFLQRTRQAPVLREREPDGAVIESDDFALAQVQS